MLSVERCYEVLGLSTNASYDEAKAAYRDLACMLHPDKYMHNDRLRERATEKFKELQNVWSELENYYRTGGFRNREQEEYAKSARERERREAEARERELRERQVREREAALRAEALRKKQSERNEVYVTCHVCGKPYVLPFGNSLENYRCGECGVSLCKKQMEKENRIRKEEEAESHRESVRRLQEKAHNKETFKVAFPVYLLIYSIILYAMGGWGIIITVFTAPLAFLFLWLGCFGPFSE